MPCGCQKNKGNSASVNKAVRQQTKPSRPATNGRIISGSGRVEKRIIR